MKIRIKKDQKDAYLMRKRWLEENCPGDYEIRVRPPFCVAMPSHSPDIHQTVVFEDVSYGFYDNQTAIKFKLSCS
jgi:hypothetical protein